MFITEILESKNVKKAIVKLFIIIPDIINDV
jgi:hypothetical protein